VTTYENILVVIKYRKLSFTFMVKAGFSSTLVPHRYITNVHELK
jgi:hypothetical protein